MKDERRTLHGAEIETVNRTGSAAKFFIPDMGSRWFHQNGIHEDSSVWWEIKNGEIHGEFGPGKLILYGWYAEAKGLDLD